MGSKVFSLLINEYQTKLAHLNLKKDKIELLSLGYDNTVPTFFTNPTDKSIELEAQLIMQIYKQLNIKQSKVQIVIPDSLSYSQLMIMPQLKDEELDRAIRLQVDDIIPLPISETNIDFEIVSQLPDNKILVLFVAIENKIADHIAKTIEYTKLEPVSLENELAVLGRFFSEVHSFMNEPSIVVNFGFGASSFYLMNPPFPYFQHTRTVKIGLSTYLRDLKINMNLNGAKSLEALEKIGLSTNGSINIAPVVSPITTELINEIQKTMDIATEKYKSTVKHIYFLNYDKSIAHLYETVQNRLSIPALPVPVDNLIVENPISTSFKQNLTAFLPVMAGHLR